MLSLGLDVGMKIATIAEKMNNRYQVMNIFSARLLHGQQNMRSCVTLFMYMYIIRPISNLLLLLVNYTNCLTGITYHLPEFNIIIQIKSLIAFHV